MSRHVFKNKFLFEYDFNLSTMGVFQSATLQKLRQIPGSLLQNSRLSLETYYDHLEAKYGDHFVEVWCYLSWELFGRMFHPPPISLTKDTHIFISVRGFTSILVKPRWHQIRLLQPVLFFVDSKRIRYHKATGETAVSTSCNSIGLLLAYYLLPMSPVF